MNFLAVKGPELLSKWLGESEKALQSLFKKARAAAPTVIFFDEVDALAGKRGSGDDSKASERVLSQLLTELDGVQPLRRVVVVAATNRPDLLDPALLRPGRIDRKVYVPPPDRISRREILDIALRGVPVDESTLDLESVSERTEGFSGAEMVALCREAALCAVEEDPVGARWLRGKHMEEALLGWERQITPEMLDFYRGYAAERRR
jgi:AAA family ATPase